MAKQGSKKVKIAGVDDKRQISVVLAGSLTGELLPLQLVYLSKTKKCLPKVKFPDDWLICALCIFDNFLARCTSRILQLLDDN